MTNDQVLDAGMAKIREMADKAIIESLSELAEKSIEHVLSLSLGSGHSRGVYENATFNMHDSHGYAIYHNGQIKKKWMVDPVAELSDAEGKKGKDRGSIFLDNFASTGSWQLVVVAGEFYAEELKYIYQLDVLTGAFSYTRENFLRDFKKIN